MRRILFVDDNPDVIAGLRRMLHKHNGTWSMDFALNPQEALGALESAGFDAIVADMRMPGMSGAQLLNEVKRLYPGMVRFILSGSADSELIMQCVGCAHQYLDKPCDSQTLIATIEGSFALRDLVSSDVHRDYIGSLPSLPSLPETYQKLVAALGNEECSLETIGDIVSSDVAMTTKIMQMVNSAFFGLPKRVDSPREAVRMLGVETLRPLVLAAGVFDQFEASAQVVEELKNIYSHSIAVGTLAQQYAKDFRLSKRLVGDALLAGMMHDVGRAILLLHYSKDYDSIREQADQQGVPTYVIERETLGATHAEFGAYLLSLWGESDSIVEAVAYHHEPGKARNSKLSALTVVHIADVLQHRASNYNFGKISNYDLDYLAQLDLPDGCPHFSNEETAIPR